MRKILYHHIPKTGGQSLALRLASAFALGRSSYMAGDLSFPEGREKLSGLLESKDFVEAHINGPVLEGFDELDVLVTVRDPIAQIVSNYLHILREPANTLHRVAHLLSPERFFDQYGDFFCNHQTRYFVSAFRTLDVEPSQVVEMTTRMLESLKCVKWLVPTESIDDFCFLWQVENQRVMSHQDLRTNVAGNERGEKEQLTRIVSKRPELYAVDLLLWQAARDEFLAYKKRVSKQVLAGASSNHWGRVWSEDASAILLGEGWHQPYFTDHGVEYWAGPQNLSEVQIKRSAAQRWLVFTVHVFHRVADDEVRFLNADGTALPMQFRRINDQQVMYAIDLEGSSESDVAYLRVPEVWSPAMVDHGLTDVARRSVATSNWQLASNAPEGLGIVA